MSEPKRVSVQHGRLRVAVPAGWEDDTTVSFFGPPREHRSAGPIAMVERSRPTFTVSLERLPPGIGDARDFLTRLGEGLKAAGGRLRDISLEPFQMAGRNGFLADREIEVSAGTLRQLTAAVIVGTDVLLATAAADAAIFEHEAGLLRAMLAEVGLEAAP